jgi:hypothetical protein
MTTKGVAASLAVLFSVGAHAQTNLNFNNIAVTSEGAIRLSWNSTSNEVYEIDYADSLMDTNTGDIGITWNLLYDDYPSQGTKTFWLDTGNYFNEPPIPHPRRALGRFYRISLTGTNTAPPPAVSITAPTNNASAAGYLTVIVAASTDQPFVSTKLYVDGQEMWERDSTTNLTASGTNYVIDTYIVNTCEWPNGSHTLFATARTESAPSGMHDVGDVDIGRAVSSFVGVAFGNLITRISFSQPFFVPENGQTQQVMAVFAANANWALDIQNATSNTVRTTSGTGTSMVFNWDGTGQGGTNLPVGNYTFLFTAQTNGALSPVGAGSASSLSVSSSMGDSEGTQLWGVPSDGSGDPAPLFLYPPTMNTNSLTIFEGPLTLSRPRTLTAVFSSGPDGNQDPGYSGPSSQSTRAPKRPPTSPTKGSAGMFGLAYDTYRGVASGYRLQGPDNGLHIGVRVELEGYSGSTYFKYPVIRDYFAEAQNFVTEMKRGNWSVAFRKVDDALKIDDLRASGANVFNQVQVGLLMLHGTYGTSPDYTASSSTPTYFPITAGPSAEYLRITEMSLGSSNTNGLKWMAIAACNSIRQQNWLNMLNYGVQPANANLHLLLGTDSVVWSGPHVTSYWARYMTRGKIVLTPMSVQESWFTGAQDAYAETFFNYTNVQYFAAAGDAACQNDFLQTNSPPGGTPFYTSVKVWPLP